MKHKLLQHYLNTDNSHVWTWDERTSIVALTGWQCLLVPSEGETEGEPHPGMRAGIRELRETEPAARMTLSLGELTRWAMRRERTDTLAIWCDACGCHSSAVEWRADPQNIMGTPYGREVIRESLTWLYQHRVAFEAPVELRLVPHLGHHVLVMRCDAWTAIVMQMKPREGETQWGTDPLPAPAQQHAPSPDYAIGESEGS